MSRQMCSGCTDAARIVCQCVKALVYYDAQTCRLDLQNDKGDTAMHMAARWGYEGIIQVLLENGASSGVINKTRDSPLQCALNSKVSLRLRFLCMNTLKCFKLLSVHRRASETTNSS